MDQVLRTGNAVRVLWNNWLRDGAPCQMTGGILTATATGTAGAIRAGSASHPLTGYIEIANLVEVNASNVPTQDGGYWKIGDSALATITTTAATTGTTTVGGAAWTVNQWQDCCLTFTTGPAAGLIGAIVKNTATVITNTTISTPTGGGGDTAQITKPTTYDGLHPAPYGYHLMKVKIKSFADALSLQQNGFGGDPVGVALALLTLWMFARLRLTRRFLK